MLLEKCIMGLKFGFKSLVIVFLQSRKTVIFDIRSNHFSENVLRITFLEQFSVVFT